MASTTSNRMKDASPDDGRARDVIAVMVFGELEGICHVLLSWNHYAREYQLVSAEVSPADAADAGSCARCVIGLRVSPAAAALLSYAHMARFSNCIVLCGEVCAGGDGDLIEELKAHNERNSIRMESLPAEALPYHADLDRLEWVPLDELLEHPASHEGYRVQGMGEVIDALGRDGLVRFSSTAVHVC